MKRISILAFLTLISLSFAIDIEFYYGQGCPHCAATESLFEEFSSEYDLQITEHEVYHNAFERAKMFSEYEMFGQDPSKGGVPTTIVDDRSFVIGALKREQWEALFDACKADVCPSGIFKQSDFNIDTTPIVENITENGKDPIYEKDSTSALTLSVIIGAAIVDSINPCTIAVMVLLISAVLYAKGKKDALTSGIVFTAIIFIMYMLYGFGILHAISSLEISRIFYIVVTVGALALSILELNAYINYKPGFMAVEMPMFMRPYTKKVTQKATSPLGVAIAAVLCSVFLIPCSSGPYLLVLGMISESATLQTVSYLLIYNLLFVLPMLIITIAVYLGKTTIEQVGQAKDKYIKQIHLFSGIILFILFLMMLNQLLGIL